MAKQSPHKHFQRRITDGKFEDGRWYCDCEPRLPAAYLLVKNETPNKGRYFYTCPKPRGSQCTFFMFEELAQQREKVALFYSDGNTRGKAPGTNTNTTPAKTANRNTWIAATTPTRPEALRRAETPRSEVGSVFGGNSPVLSPRSSVFPTPTPGKQRIFRGIPRSFEEVDDSESDNVATAEGAARSAPRGGQPQPGPSQPFSTPKRKRVADDDEDEYGGDDLDGDELIAVADTVASRTATPSSSQFSNNAPVTPSRAGRTTGAHAGFTIAPASRANQSAGASSCSEPRPKRAKTTTFPDPVTPTSAWTRNALINSTNNNNNNTPNNHCRSHHQTPSPLPSSSPSSPFPSRSRKRPQPQRRHLGPDDEEEEEEEEDITVEVLGALNQWAAAGRRLLETAREALRSAVAERDARIAWLEARVAELEGGGRAAGKAPGWCSGGGVEEGGGGT